MRTIRPDNPVLSSYLTDLSADYSPTQVSPLNLAVRNTNSFSANDLLVVGNPTEEYSEGKKITALASLIAFTLASALNFQHNKGTPVYKTLWDFISIEGRSSSAGTFAELSQSPIQWDSPTGKTIYHHSAGTDSWEYRVRYYNSVTGAYSEYSPTVAGTGFLENQMGYIIKEARRVAGDREGKILTTDECLRALTRAKNIIRAHNARYWFWKVNGFNSDKKILGTANTSVYSLASIDDLGIMDTIEFRYTNGNIDQRKLISRKPDAEFMQITGNMLRPVNDRVSMFRLLPPDENSSKGYFELDYKLQNDNVAIFYINYYKVETGYSSVEDSTSIIIPEILQDYLISEIYGTKGNEANQKKYADLFFGPQQKKKMTGIENLTGIALLDELDRQYKTAQGQPSQLWRFRGQKGASRLYGYPRGYNTDYYKENYFSDER